MTEKKKEAPLSKKMGKIREREMVYDGRMDSYDQFLTSKLHSEGYEAFETSQTTN